MISTGLVLNECVLVRPGVVRVDFDLAQHRFLRDHRVDGRALLSTVMGIEVMACAASLIPPDVEGPTVRSVTVGPPFFVEPSARGSVEVDVRAAADHVQHCTVRSGDVRHFTADLAVENGASPPVEMFEVVGAGVPAAEIYRLFFHGRSFQVLEQASYSPAAMIGRLALGLPPVSGPDRAALFAPLLIELCMQSAGLWDLAARATMTVPAGIDRVRRWSSLDADSGVPMTAVVTPCSTGVFDAAVRTADGQVVLTIDGYRTTPFAHPYDTVAADRLRGLLTTRA